jgi:hypothetical protein
LDVVFALLYVQCTCKCYLLILHTWTYISISNCIFNTLFSSKFLKRLTNQFCSNAFNTKT